MSFRLGDFAPMGCGRASLPFDDAAFRFEPKLDGIRALAYADGAGGIRLQTRSGADATERYPEVVAAVAAALGERAAVIDGEVCALGEGGAPDFALLLRRESARGGPARREAAQRIVYYVFDLLAEEDLGVVAEALERRRERLLGLLGNPGPSLRPIEFLPGDGRAAFHAATALGYEGVVGKRLGSPYLPGRRSADWVKVKRSATADLVVGAWVPGRGALAGTVGALAVGAYDAEGALRWVGTVGSGLSFRERDAMRVALLALSADRSPFAEPSPVGARFVRPVLVVEVAFQEITRGGRLRGPVLRGIRPDKPPRECLLVTEVAARPGRDPV